jgi:hypothetical protein
MMLRFGDRLLRAQHERIPNDEHRQEDDLADEEQATMVPVSLEGEGDTIERMDRQRNRSSTNSIDHEETESLQPEAVSSTSPSESQFTADDHEEQSNTSEENTETHDLSHLLVQREYHRWGTKICTIILALVLFRLWVEALLTLNVVLIIFSSFMTSYLFAWRVHRASVEYDLNQEIDSLQNNPTDRDSHENNEIATSVWRRSGRTRRAFRNHNRVSNGRHRGRIYDFDDWDFGANRDHIDLEMLGFQAQLALAIMESQRHILETGGYGRPDGGEDESQMHGVRDETMAKWSSFAYNSNDPKVKQCADLKPYKNEEPSCCICLCEYEEGEMLNQLDCGHVYHQECIHSWCQNHSRCPLCNMDLEDSSDFNHTTEVV